MLASAEEQIMKLQTIVANQRNDKETILDLRNRILEYQQSNQDAARDFKKFKTHTQGIGIFLFAIFFCDNGQYKPCTWPFMDCKTTIKIP